MPARTSRPTKSPKLRSPLQTSLSLPEPGERLGGLLRQHDGLLRKIAKQKKAFAALERRIDDATHKLAAAQPLAEECRRLDPEIHGLFAELLARRRQPRQTRQVVVAVYNMLQRSGVLSPRDSDSWADGEPGSPDFFSARGEPTGEGAPGGTAEGRRGGAGGYSARRPGDESEDRSIRALFRDLATALHPDKVHDEAEKGRRTELMKDVSRAYAEGDLARLLELRRAWTDGGAVTSAPDDPHHRCATLERMNEALLRQLRDLTKDLRLLRLSPRARILQDLERLVRQQASRGGPGGVDPVAVMIAQAQEELNRMRELRAFVVSFRDGQITIDGFARGPQSMRSTDPDSELDDDPDDVLDDPDFLDFVESLLGSAESPRPRRGRRRPGRRRSKGDTRPMDIPF